MQLLFFPSFMMEICFYLYLSNSGEYLDLALKITCKKTRLCY